MKFNPFRILRREHKAHVFLGQIRLFRFPERLFFDKCLCAENRALIDGSPDFTPHFLQKKNGSILLVSNNLQKIGGVERRLESLIGALHAAGHPVYVLTEPGDNLQTSAARSLELNFNASNFGESLLAIIRKFNIKVIEFQCKNVSYLRYLDLEAVRKQATCGCTIHFCGKLPFAKIREMDYRIFVSERMQLWYRKKIPLDLPCRIIYNGVPLIPDVWHFNNQRRAVYISRIGYGYLPKIRQFIEYCQSCGIDFHIAGSGRNPRIIQKIRTALSREYNFPEACFIGGIETVSFLKEHASEYLFAAGVGQVALECAASGMPVLILSDHALNDATFATPENYSFFRNRNFTIKRQPDVIRTLDINKVSSYPIREQIIRDRSQEKISREYISFIEQYL